MAYHLGSESAFSPQKAWDELVHKDDRTSPEEYPDHCLISFDELQDFMMRGSREMQGPVSWRWRPRGATNWIYDPTEEWRKEHEGDIESEPLYAAQATPCPGCDGHECDNGCRYPGAVQAMPARARADYKIGWWLSAALEDTNVCAEMKADINAWFEAHQSTAGYKASSMAFVCPKCGTRGTTNGCSSSVAETDREVGK